MNIWKVARLLALVAWSAAVFGAGTLWEQHRVLSRAYVTTRTLELQPPGTQNTGTLPPGSAVYAYGGPDEQPLFVVFLGTKSLDAMRAANTRHWLEVNPVLAHSR